MVTFSDFSIRALGYAELVRAAPDQKLTIPLILEGANVADTNCEVPKTGQRYTAQATLESKFTSRAIGLVKGGWLPPALAASRGATLLPDRNVISQISGRFDEGNVVAGERDFIDLFAGQEVRINPLLWAMESNIRRIPTPELASEQLAEAVEKLRRALPRATLDAGPGHLKGALGIIEDTRAGFARKERFLSRVAPLISSPVARRKLDERWQQVLAAAVDCEVPHLSLVVLAALSTVAVPNGKSPSRKVLKLNESPYTEGHAYNALADLRSLEMMMYLLAFFPESRFVLCTCDRPLALFWSGLRASDFERVGSGITFVVSPVEDLFPGEAMGKLRTLFTTPTV